MGLVEAGWLVVVFVIGLLGVFRPPLFAPGCQDPGHYGRSAEDAQGKFLYIIHIFMLPIVLSAIQEVHNPHDTLEAWNHVS